MSFIFHLFPKQLEKLNTQLAEAEAALEARKKPPEENGPKIVGEGLVIDEWVCISLQISYGVPALCFLVKFLFQC